MNWIRKSKRSWSAFILGLFLLGCNQNEPIEETVVIETVPSDEIISEEPVANPADGILNASSTIKIALLLDTSGSMDGLIEQAKSQLWKIVNQLALAKKGNDFANVLIALYEYGNDGINYESGYVRQVVGLTDDLDEISKELFALSTNGGSEYCGQVIAKSLSELDWGKETGGLQVMFIAGNEEFTQGQINYETACSDAAGSDIIVNTIYCGDSEEGIRTMWKHGADLTDGFYGTIEMNEATVYIETPYDDRIQELNTELNKTYLAYGNQRMYYSMNQQDQDNNSTFYGSGNAVERTITKSSHLYKNDKWDLVDAKKNEEFDLDSVKDEELPEEMKGMTASQKEAYVENKEAERTKIQEEIQSLNVKRMEYIEAKKEEMGDPSAGLDRAMMEAIKRQAIAKNFRFEQV